MSSLGRQKQQHKKKRTKKLVADCKEVQKQAFVYVIQNWCS